MTLTIPKLQELRHVEAYDLATFLQGVEQAIKDGYEISLEHIVTGKQIGRASCRERVLRLV